MERKRHRRIALRGAQVRHHARSLFGRHLRHHHALIADDPPLESRQLRGIDTRVQPSEHTPARQSAGQGANRKLEGEAGHRVRVLHDLPRQQQDDSEQQSDQPRPQSPAPSGDAVLIHMHRAGVRAMHRRRPAKAVAAEICQGGPGGSRALVKANHQRAVCRAPREFHTDSVQDEDRSRSVQGYSVPPAHPAVLPRFRRLIDLSRLAGADPFIRPEPLGSRATAL